MLGAFIEVQLFGCIESQVQSQKYEGLSILKGYVMNIVLQTITAMIRNVTLLTSIFE